MEDFNNEKVCLKWNNFHKNFMSQFEVLKQDEDFVDVTLYSYGQCIKAHKVVLSACSPYLKSIFKENPCKHPIIILDNLSFNNLEALIQFIYTGQVYIEQDELSSFLKAAETLQIRGLFESSDGQDLMKTNEPQVHLTDSSIACKKREGDFDNESKKLRSKRLLRRVSNSCKREINEVYEEQKIKPSVRIALETIEWNLIFQQKEKDCCISTNNKLEENSESTSTSLNIINEDQNLENEDKILNGSSGEEEFIPGELKRPHWLDPRSCPLCNRVYSNLSNLRQHIKLIHNPTLVTCKICYKTFKTELYLRRHLISFHELNVNGSGSNSLSIESYTPNQNQTCEWNPNIKIEPDAFQEMFNSNEIYKISQ